MAGKLVAMRQLADFQQFPSCKFSRLEMLDVSSLSAVTAKISSKKQR
jgi:hypothetical protein